MGPTGAAGPQGVAGATGATGAVGPAGPVTQGVAISNLQVNGPFSQLTSFFQGPFDCPAGRLGTGLRAKNSAGSVAFGLECNTLSFNAPDGGGLTAVLTNPAASGLFGAALAISNGVLQPPASCPSGSVLTGIQYLENFGGYTNYAGRCTPAAAGGATVVTNAIGVLIGSGTPRQVDCPAGRVVTGLSGYVDGSGTPVQITIRCN
jgi:hypothetical protein